MPCENASLLSSSRPDKHHDRGFLLKSCQRMAPVDPEVADALRAWESEDDDWKGISRPCSAGEIVLTKSRSETAVAVGGWCRRLGCLHRAEQSMWLVDALSPDLWRKFQVPAMGQSFLALLASHSSHSSQGLKVNRVHDVRSQQVRDFRPTSCNASRRDHYHPLSSSRSPKSIGKRSANFARACQMKTGMLCQC